MPRSDSHGFDARLRVTVRERLASGALFRTGPNGYAGKSTGKPCIVCAKSISEGEIGHEIVGPTTVWAHWDCYSAHAMVIRRRPECSHPAGPLTTVRCKCLRQFPSLRWACSDLGTGRIDLTIWRRS